MGFIIKEKTRELKDISGKRISRVNFKKWRKEKQRNTKKIIRDIDKIEMKSKEYINRVARGKEKDNGAQIILGRS